MTRKHTPAVGDILRVVSGAEDLGIAIGERASVAAVYGGKMDLTFDRMDTTVAGLNCADARFARIPAARKATEHPAITALRVEHEAFRASLATRGVTTGSLYDADLRTDFKAITLRWPDRPFVWFIHSMATHMSVIPTPQDCYETTKRTWYASENARHIDMLIANYRDSPLSEDWTRVYVWDGRTLTRATTATLPRMVCSLIRSRAVAHLESTRQFLTPIGSPAEISELDQAIATTREWGES